MSVQDLRELHAKMLLLRQSEVRGTLYHMRCAHTYTNIPLGPAEMHEAQTRACIFREYK